MEKQIELRDWQKEAFKRLQEVLQEGKKEFLCVACVGTGKTLFSAYIFNFLKKKGIIDSVVIISPTENIKRNWAKEIERAFRLKIDHGYTFKHAWPRDCHGISITYQSLSQQNIELLKKHINSKTMIIVDEVHHAGDQRSWGDAIKQIGIQSGFRLLLSGTPDRPDNSPIPFVSYRHNPKTDIYVLESNYAYGYAQAISDKVVCHVIFPRNSAEAPTFSGKNKKVEYSGLPNDESDESKKWFNQILTVHPPSHDSKPSWVYQTFEKANRMLNEINDSWNENYAGLIVCNSIEDAKNLYEHIFNNYGPDFVELVTSDDKESSQKIERFTYSMQSWIISIKMISEGVDIPRIRCIVYASNVITKIRFIQVMGRGVRNPNNHIPDHSDVCHFYLPDYAPLIRNAEEIEKELAHIYKRIEEEKEERKKREEAGAQIMIDDLMLEWESIDAGDVFDGDLWNAQESLQAADWAKKVDVSKNKVLELLKIIKQDQGQPTPAEREVPFQTSTEEKDTYRRRVHTLVNKISCRLDGNKKPRPETIRKVHIELNKHCGIRLSNTATLDQLKRKYRAAGNWLMQIK